MERLNRVLRLLLLAMVTVVGPLGATAGIASAQGAATAEDTYVSELSDIEIEVSGDVQIADSYTEQYEHGEGEIVELESPGAIMQVAFFDDTDDPETTIELYNAGFENAAESFAVVDQGLAGDVAWSLASATLSGEDVYYYIRVAPDVVGNVDVMESIAGPADGFLDEFDLVQRDVLIDGNELFAGVDSADLEALIAAGGSGTSVPDEDDAGTTGTAVPEDDDAGTTGTTAAGDVFVSEISGIEIELAEPFVVSDSQIYGSGAESEESVTIQGNYSSVPVGFFIGDDAQTSLEEFLTGFDGSAQERTEIAGGYEDGVAWTFSEAVLGDGAEVLMYISIREDASPDYLVMQGMIGQTDAFYDEFALAQESILIDGEMIYPDITAADLEALAEGGATGISTPAGEDDQGTTAVGETERTREESDEADSRRDRARLPGEDTNETETGEAETPVAGGTGFEDAGLVAYGEYESPQYGTAVVWGDTWFIDQEDEESVVSDPASGMDSLFLVWDGPDFAMTFIDISAADGLTPDDFVAYWVSDDYLAESADPNAEILLEDATRDSGAVIMRDYLSEGDEVIIAKEAISLDGGETIAVVTMIGFPETFADTYADAEGDIEIDEMYAFNVFRPREVENVLNP